MGNTWNELHIIKTLPMHPNLVSFDRVVLDDAESQALGFTTEYYAGGTLDDSTSRVFRLSWLQQLTAVVDYLNFEQGIIHQDLASRNLHVDLENNLRLFDFDRAAYIGQPEIVVEWNDVAGVILTAYEIITNDEKSRRNKFEQRDPNEVLNLKDWPVECHLDTVFTLFWQHLNYWVQQRKERQQMAHIQQRRVPDMPLLRPVMICFDEIGKSIYERIVTQMRVDALNFRQHVVSWERPPYQEAYPNGAGKLA